MAEAFTYWAIAHRVSPRRWRVVTGRVVCAGLNRTSVQSAVTETVLAEWVAYLKTLQK